MDAYLGPPFYITIANFGKADIHPRKHQDVGQAANSPQEIVYIKDDRFPYSTGEEVSENDSLVNTVHYKPTPDNLNQVTGHEAVRYGDKETIKKDWYKDTQLPTKF